jgi:cardiolipin synthase
MMKRVLPSYTRLQKKASQGLKVCLLLDALGSVKIHRKFIAPLLETGGEAVFFKPMIPALSPDREMPGP